MTAASLLGQALFYGYPPEVKDGQAGIDFLLMACSARDPSAQAFFDKEFARPKKLSPLPATRPDCSAADPGGLSQQGPLTVRQ
jgi:hypothetical protein